MFTALEGIDASGKATQAKLLAERIKAKLFSFPDYETKSGQIILAHLKREWSAKVDFDFQTKVAVEEGLRPDEEYLDAFVFQALQIMNRMEHAADMYEHLYKYAGNIVADRFTASGMVYGRLDGLDATYLKDIQRYLPQPDLWILVDIDVETSIQRRPERRDRYEQDKDYMERVADAYRQLWVEMQAAEGTKWVVIDGKRSVGDVHEEILNLVSGYYEI